MIGFYNYTVVATYISLAAAVTGICFALSGNPAAAVYCLLASGFLDMFDGKIARTRKRTKEEERFGIQIDSLTDLVCFGVLPAVIGYSLWSQSGMTGVWHKAIVFAVCAVYVLAALVRLAYYNVTEEIRQDQTDEKRSEFTGLPVTTVALIFPFVYALGCIIPNSLSIVYIAVLFAAAIAFVAKVRVPKPGMVGAIVMTALGLVEVLLLIFGKSLFCK